MRLIFKIDQFDMRQNTGWSNVDTWQEIFKNMEVTTLLMDIPHDGQVTNSIMMLIGLLVCHFVYRLYSVHCIPILFREIKISFWNF